MLVPLLIAAGSFSSASAAGADAGAPAMLFITDPSGTSYTPLTCLAFAVHRYANRVGNWAVTVPVDERLDATGIPTARNIRSGWKVTIRQERNGPLGVADLYMVTNDVIERREYKPADGGAVLMLSGSMREVGLTRAEVHSTLSYTDQPAQAIAQAVAGESVIVASFNSTRITVDFNSGTKYAALLKVGELARLTLRETWDGDALEFTAIDGAPDSGITLVGLEQVGPEATG